MEMRAQQIFVPQIDTRSCDPARDHQLWSAEEVLIVGTSSGAVCEDERGLAASTCPATALGVIGRSRRNVPEVHDVQSRDVDAELHRRGTEEDRQFAGSEPFLALLALFVRDLSRMLSRLEPLSVGRGCLIEVEKEAVWPTTPRWWLGHSNGIVNDTLPF